MQMGELQIRVTSPRTSECGGEVSFFGEKIMSSVSHAAGLNKDNFAAIVDEVGEQQIVVGQPREPRLHSVKVRSLCEPFPMLSSPRFGGDEACCFLSDAFVWGHLSRRKDAYLVEVLGRPLIIDRELGESVDVVSPQINTDWCICGRWENVDDRSSTRKFPPVLNEFFTSVSRNRELFGESVGIDAATC
tara:strand:- start:73 stop:639 length:567 start_codon:yes stop_codon:yes gene_type:complete